MTTDEQKCTCQDGIDWQAFAKDLYESWKGNLPWGTFKEDIYPFDRWRDEFKRYLGGSMGRDPHTDTT